MDRYDLIMKYEKRLQKENPDRIDQLYCEFIRDLTELEQTKVKVPEFVAEWIEQCKEKGKSLLNALLYTPGGVNRWVDDPDNQEAFALAWMFGYTIKKEKLYFVSLKGVYHGDLGYADNFNGYSFYNKDRNLSGIKYKHTRKELEDAGFGWVFDCPGIEVLEVGE